MKVAIISSSKIEYAQSDFVKLSCPRLDGCEELPYHKIHNIHMHKTFPKHFTGKKQAIAGTFVDHIDYYYCFDNSKARICIKKKSYLAVLSNAYVWVIGPCGEFPSNSEDASVCQVPFRHLLIPSLSPTRQCLLCS